MQNICQHTPPPAAAAAAAAAADASQTQRRDIYCLQSHVKMARAKSTHQYIFAQHSLIENTQPTELLNIGITFDIFAQFTVWQKKLYPFSF